MLFFIGGGSVGVTPVSLLWRRQPHDELFRGARQPADRGAAAGHRLGRQQVQTQASFLAYVDAFWALMLIALATVPLARAPLALTLRTVKLAGAKPTAP